MRIASHVTAGKSVIVRAIVPKAIPIAHLLSCEWLNPLGIQNEPQLLKLYAFTAGLSDGAHHKHLLHGQEGRHARLLTCFLVSLTPTREPILQSCAPFSLQAAKPTW